MWGRATSGKTVPSLQLLASRHYFLTSPLYLQHLKKGFYVQPTIITDVKTSMQIWREEVFGPVLCVKTFATEEEAIELANDTQLVNPHLIIYMSLHNIIWILTFIYLQLWFGLCRIITRPRKVWTANKGEILSHPTSKKAYTLLNLNVSFFVLEGVSSRHCMGQLLAALLLASSMGRQETQWFWARTWRMVSMPFSFRAIVSLHQIKKTFIPTFNHAYSTLVASLSGGSITTWTWSKLRSMYPTMRGVGTSLQQSCENSPAVYCNFSLYSAV